MTGKGKSGDDQFAKYARAVAVQLMGEPNKQLSSKDELRFGSHGSLSVDLEKGTWFDHSANEGGGVLKLIERETGQGGPQAVDWLRDNGFYVEDRPQPPSYGNDGQGGQQRKPARFDENGNYLPNRVPDHGRLSKVYDYRDEKGALRYQVARFDWDDPTHKKGHDKTFMQRVPDPKRKDGFSYSVKGVEPLPYRLGELLEDIADGAEIFVVPGEKKVDMLRDLGVPATCNSGGESRFADALAEWFRGARVTVIQDNDPVGKSFAGKVARVLDGVAERVRALDIPGLPPSGNVDDWLPAGGTVEELYRLAKAAPLAQAEAFESKFDAVDWLDIDAPGPKHEWLIKRVLTRGEVSMLAGPSQSGKSFLALDQALAIARGVDWFGHKVVHGGVLYCASESAVGVRRKRLPAYRKHYNVAHEPIPFTLIQKPLDLYASDEHVDALIEEAAHWSRRYQAQHGVKLELIVIDTLSAATPGWDENSSRDVGPVLARCARLGAATGAHVMFVHHLNADGTKARGHTSIFANIENVMIVKKLENSHDANNRVVREMVITKQKEEEDGEKFKFVLPAVQIGQDSDGDKITSCIVATPAGEAGQQPTNPTAIQLGGANQKVLRALYEVLSDQLSWSPAPPELGLAPGARVADRRKHTAKFFALERPDDFEDRDEAEQKRIGDAARQALKRARDMLYSKGIIGVNEELIWLTGKPVQGFGPPPGVKTRRQKETEEAKDAEAQRSAISAAFGDDDNFDPGQI